MSKKLFATPFLLWIACGTVIPLAVIAFYGFTDRSGAFTADNIMAIFSAEHAQALGLALLLSLLSTVICFVLAFPLALVLKDSNIGQKGFMIFIFMKWSMSGHSQTMRIWRWQSWRKWEN